METSAQPQATWFSVWKVINAALRKVHPISHDPSHQFHREPPSSRTEDSELSSASFFENRSSGFFNLLGCLSKLALKNSKRFVIENN
eukprot:1195750-Prorocentrum_minimum.AAC.3